MLLLLLDCFESPVSSNDIYIVIFIWSNETILSIDIAYNSNINTLVIPLLPII